MIFGHVHDVSQKCLRISSSASPSWRLLAASDAAATGPSRWGVWLEHRDVKPRKFLGSINRTEESLELLQSSVAMGIKVLGAHNPAPRLHNGWDW